MDGVEHDKISVDSDFVVKLRTSAPAGVANPPPVFFLGGVNLTTSATEGLPNFRGCLKDFSYSFQYVQSCMLTIPVFAPTLRNFSMPFRSTTHNLPFIVVLRKLACLLLCKNLMCIYDTH